LPASRLLPPSPPVFRARTTAQLHAECQREFARLGTDQAKVINMLMETWLRSPRTATAIDPSRLVGKPRRRKDIWLNETLLEEVEKRAAADGLPVATWIALLIQSALMADPVVLDKELLALENQIRELSAIGRNLNQITHHLNTESARGDPPDTRKIKMDLIEKIQSEIKQLRTESHALIRARRKAWGLSHGRD